jgi:hypothetical protein
MRDYGKVSPQFWVGKTGKALRGNLPAQILALYLMTSPHANMIGVYYCPIEYMAKETGLPIEGASEALQSLIDADFCTYEADSELIFVHAFAEHQIGGALKATDLRVKGIQNELEKVPQGQCYQAFVARYSIAFNLPINEQEKPKTESPIEAPLEALRSQKQKQKQKQKQNIDAPPDGVAATVWQDFQKIRKAKRAPITETAIDGIRVEADKAGYTLNQALETCCKRGWQGFEAEWVTGKPALASVGGMLPGAI